jgi:zinc transport system permease protein
LLNNVYFHWLFDILPRINLLELAGINYEDIDYWLSYAFNLTSGATIIVVSGLAYFLSLGVKTIN